MPRIILGIIISYLIGSIPTAYLFGLWLKGVDIRKFGSGNVGATNALRVLGKIPGIIVLLLDILKGFLAVFYLIILIAPRVTFVNTQLLCIVFGLACIAGHNWTIFLRFKGGKGIATTLGVLIAMCFKVTGMNIVLFLLIVSWVIIFSVSRIVSLASVLTALVLPVYALIVGLPKSIIILSIVLSFFVILRHKANLKRLFKKEEPRLF